MPSSLVSLTDLMSGLLSEAELRALFDRLGLGKDLPGAGVPLTQLSHEAAALLLRRGRADAAFFQALADLADGRSGEVAALAVAMGMAAPMAKAVSAAPARGGSTFGSVAIHGGNVQVGDDNTMTVRAHGALVPPAVPPPPTHEPVDPSEDPRIRDLRDLIAKRQLVVIVGAGVSLASSGGAATAGWKGLLLDGIARCQTWGLADPKWCDLQRRNLDEGEVEDWIGVGRRLTQKLGGPKGGEYRRWLREAVGTLKVVDRSVIEALVALGCPIATTNYDGLIEEISGWPSVSWDEGSEVERVLRGADPGVLHLHGYWRRPESVVLGVESYLAVRDEPHAKAVRQSLRLTHSLLFVGCGETTEDPNIGAWLRWSGELFAGSEYHSYRLERDDRVAEVQKQHPPEQRVFVIGYGRAHGDLPAFIRRLAPRGGGLEVP